MLPKIKELPEITDLLDDFVEKLLIRVADESEQGRAELVASMEAAKKLYKEPTESWVYGWFYLRTRTRGPEVDSAISVIKAFPDAYTRLQELKLLVKKGEWVADSSYNYYLFVELIRSVPGYKPLEAELIYPITIKIKNKILDKIDSFMYQYKANQKMVEERKKELALTHNSTPKKLVNTDHVLLFNNVDDAQNSAKNNVDKIHFVLTLTDGIWDVSWVDLSGKVHTLDVNTKKELIALLVEHEIEDVAQINEVFAKRLEGHDIKNVDQIREVFEKRIKEECIKERDRFLKEGSFLQKAELLVNPIKIATHEEKSNLDLKSEGTTATFVLRGKPHAYRLTWINHVGNAKAISLDTYPQLKKWLDLQNPLSEKQHPELKAYLLQVDTSLRMIGKDSVKAELEVCLASGPKKPVVTSPPTPTQTTSKKLDLSKFAKVTKCLQGGGREPDESNASVLIESPIEPIVAAVQDEVESSFEIPPPPNKRSYADAVRMFPPKSDGVTKSENNEQSARNSL